MYDNSNGFAFFLGVLFLIIETVGPVVGVIVCVQALRTNTDEFAALKRILKIAGLSALFATLALMAALEFVVPKS